MHHQLPASPGYAEESVRSAGRPVLSHCNAHHEDAVGDAAGGAPAVSTAHTPHHNVCDPAANCSLLLIHRLQG